MALFFTQRKPRGFDYKPRFYDPEVEAREERKRIVLGEKYKAPAKAGTASDGSSGEGSDYVPGAFLREHIAARRGNAHVADQMRKRRRKERSVVVSLGVLVLIGLIIWMLYFK